MITHPKCRKTDKQPQEWARELHLQELCNQQDAELHLVRAENARLRAQLAKMQTGRMRSVEVTA